MLKKIVSLIATAVARIVCYFVWLFCKIGHGPHHPHDYRCTRPVPLPPAKVSTSATVT